MFGIALPVHGILIVVFFWFIVTRRLQILCFKSPEVLDVGIFMSPVTEALYSTAQVHGRCR